MEGLSKLAYVLFAFLVACAAPVDDGGAGEGGGEWLNPELARYCESAAAARNRVSLECIDRTAPVWDDPVVRVRALECMALWGQPAHPSELPHDDPRWYGYCMSQAVVEAGGLW